MNIHIAKKEEYISYNCSTMIFKKLFLILAVISLSLFTFAQTITDLSGLVEIRDSENSPWRPLSLGEEFSLGAFLRSFDGGADISFDNQLIKIDKDTILARLTYYPHSYEVLEGSVYAKGDEIIFFVDGPTEVQGEVVFTSRQDIRKATVVSGILKVLQRDEIVEVLTGEQFNSKDGETKTLAAYPSFPWYKGLAEVESGIGRVIGYSGNAEIKKDTWQDVVVDDEFLTGESIRTFSDSWLEVTFADSLIRLQADTELSLKEWANYEDGSSRTVLELKQGKVWAIINNEGEPFEIETPGLIAGVRGTKFRLDSPENDAPPLIKTFIGNVAGINEEGFVEIAAGKQYDPDSGLQDLQLDALDLLNLEKDKLLGQPKLILKSVDFYTRQAKLVVVGISDADMVFINQQEAAIKNYRFSLEIDLEYGMNYIEVLAKNQDSEGEISISQAIIRIKED